MKSSNLSKLLSNYITRLWGLISVFIFVPIYISYIGIENYALIGFYTLLLGIISFADSGLSSAIIKEFALNHSASFKYSLLRNIENIYWSICLGICLIISGCSELISSKWLNSSTIEKDRLAYYVILIGIGVTVQLLSSLYFGSLFGLNKQVKANSLQIIWNLFRSAFVILLFIFIKPSLEVYFIWQIVCNVCYVTILRYLTIKELRKQEIFLRNILSSIPKHILKYISGMIVIAIISAVNTQADKIITSSFFSLKIFGYYNIVSILSQVAVILASPLTLFVFPLFSKFSFQKSDSEKLNICFEKISYLLHLIIFPASILMFLYAGEIIKLWTGKAIEVEMLPDLIVVLRFLTIGSLFLAMQFPIFYLFLSKGKTKYTIYQGLIQIFFGLPLLYLCASHYGLTGIGIPWVLINLGSLVYLYCVCFTRYLSIKQKFYFIHILIIPFIITISINGIMHIFFRSTNLSFYYFFIFGGIFSIVVRIFIINI